MAILLIATLFIFGKTTNKNRAVAETTEHHPDDGHDHGAAAVTTVSIDTILQLAKKQLTPEQGTRLSLLEHSVSRGAVKEQQLHIYHQLARFWGDSARIFEPYAWYTAEAARLENSEKSLNFAAHLFLNNLQGDEVTSRRQWKALQARDLFERSLNINPDNDSAKVGLGACYLFGSISEMPMEGIARIREVVEKDSNNVYAQITLARASILSGQYDKAISRLETVNRLDENNTEAMLLLADMYERTGNKAKAIAWYQKSLPFISQPELKKAVQERIGALQ